MIKPLSYLAVWSVVLVAGVTATVATALPLTKLAEIDWVALMSGAYFCAVLTIAMTFATQWVNGKGGKLTLIALLTPSALTLGLAMISDFITAGVSFFVGGVEVLVVAGTIGALVFVSGAVSRLNT